MLFDTTTQLIETPAFDFLTGRRFNTTAALPAEARRAMARLIADAANPRPDPRAAGRQTYHVPAELSRAGGAELFTVYTRDVNAWTIGFIGTAPLMIGARVTVRLTMPDGRPLTATARIRRSRPFRSGWFETYAEFGTPQYPFENL